MDSADDQVCTSFRLLPPVLLRNMLPCAVAFAIVEASSEVPEEYVSLLPNADHGKKLRAHSSQSLLTESRLVV